MIELFFFFEQFGAIDVHDHLRQGLLAMEREWYTHSWCHHTCMLGTIFGICIDAMTLITNMSLSRLFQIPKMLIALLHSVAKLFFNDFLEDERIVRRHSNEGEVIEEVHVIIILFLDVCKF